MAVAFLAGWPRRSVPGWVVGAGNGGGATGLGQVRLGGGHQSDVVGLAFGDVLSEVRGVGRVVGLAEGGGVVRVGRVPARGLTYGRGGTYSEVERNFVARVKLLPKLVDPELEGLGSDNPVNGVAGRIVYPHGCNPRDVVAHLHRIIGDRGPVTRVLRSESDPPFVPAPTGARR